MITVITVMTTMITVMILKENEELPKLITLVGAMKTLGIEIRDTISTEDDLLPAADEVVVPSVKWALVPCLYTHWAKFRQQVDMMSCDIP